MTYSNCVQNRVCYASFTCSMFSCFYSLGFCFTDNALCPVQYKLRAQLFPRPQRIPHREMRWDSFTPKERYTLSVKLSDFTVLRHTWRKNWVNCAVSTGKSAGPRTALSSRLSHRELHSSLRESHTFLSLPADTTMASSQGTPVSSNSFSRWASHDILYVGAEGRAILKRIYKWDGEA